MKKDNLIIYRDTEEFAKDMGLSGLEIALVKEKLRLIENLRSRRIKAKLSQSALAKKVGTQQPAIARMESGVVSQISMDFLIKVALVLGVSYSIKSKVAA